MPCLEVVLTCPSVEKIRLSQVSTAPVFVVQVSEDEPKTVIT